MSRNYLLKQSPPHEKGWFLSTAQKCTENALDMKNWHLGLTEHFQIKWGPRTFLYKISGQKWSLKWNFPFFLHDYVGKCLYFYIINVPIIQLKLRLINSQKLRKSLLSHLHAVHNFPKRQQKIFYSECRIK